MCKVLGWRSFFKFLYIIILIRNKYRYIIKSNILDYIEWWFKGCWNIIKRYISDIFGIFLLFSWFYGRYLIWEKLFLNVYDML